MARDAYFTDEMFRFMKQLSGNNNREWFQANKARYEEHVRDPFLQLIADLDAPLKTISPHFGSDPRPTGGSMMRIYRDTRFSKDKTPYKTALTAHFEHDQGARARRRGSTCISSRASAASAGACGGPSPKR